MWRNGVAFLLGTCCVHGCAQLPAEPASGALWGIALLAAIATAVRAGWRLPAAFAIGVSWAWLNAAVRLADDLPAALGGEDVLVRGYVASLPGPAKDPQFTLAVSNARSGVPARIRLTWYHATRQPQPGEQWQLNVRLKRRNGFANPGGFDYEGHLFREGIGAVGYVREDARNRRLAPPGHRYLVLQARSWIAARIAQAVPDIEVVGFVQGLAVGDTHAVTPSQWQVLAATGTTHLMAISGLHISMVAAVAAWLGGALVRWPAAQARGWTAMHGRVLAGSSAAVGYSLLAGFSIPTQRTLIMLGLYFAAHWWRREPAVGQAFGLALIGVLLVDPFAALALGAWLSFGAVAVILLAVSGRLVSEGVVTSFARVQLAVTVGLMPLLLVTLGNLSLISPLSNALAVPLFTLVLVPAVLVGALVAIVSVPAAELVFAFPAQLLRWCWPVLETMARQPLAVWHFPELPLPVLLMLVIGVLLLIVPGIWPTRVAGVLLCLPALLHRPPVPAPGDFELAVLDVGQGLSAVVRTHSHALVYDAGPAFQSGRNAGELVLLPYLRHRGIRAVDMLVVSHGDLDHRGGMRTVAEGLPVRELRVGPTVKTAQRAGLPCWRGQRWVWDGVLFEFLHPTHILPARENDTSCVLRLQGAGGSVLLAGDIEAAAEEELVSRGLARASAVVVPHHGSRTSSTADFVAASRPQLALVSAGYRNRWGLPAAEVMERWRGAGAAILDTIDSGAIEVSFVAARAPQARAYRRTHRRYWSR